MREHVVLAETLMALLTLLDTERQADPALRVVLVVTPDGS